MREMLAGAGFVDINIVSKEGAADVIKDWMPGSDAEKFVTSVYVTATKPAGASHITDEVRRVGGCCQPQVAAGDGAGGACGPGV
mmetsp:Transcript_46714/g.135984  ORF Transcript_46714/g.135984 Transcript_46714/m.135984 type:complete len:84 (+) Transcript_46714:748-999(+)